MISQTTMRQVLQSMGVRAARAVIVFAVLCVGSAAQAQLEFPQFVTVDVPTASVSGQFLVNGVLAPSDYGEQALVYLESPADDAPISIGTTNEQAYGPRVVVAGDYAPRYEFLFSEGTLPENPVKVLGPASALSGPTLVDVDVQAIDVSFELTLDGGPFPANLAESGAIWLHDSVTKTDLYVGTTDEGTIAIRIVPGVYDVVYRHYLGASVPQNLNAVVMAGVSLLTPQTVVVDVPTRVQQLSFQLNGAPFTISTNDDGEIKLRNFASGDSVSFGMTSDGSSVRTIVAGTYDVTYSRDEGSVVVPANLDAVVAEGLVLDQAGAGFPLASAIDVQASWITLDATINGGMFSPSPVENGLIVLVGREGDEVSLGQTRIASPAAVLVVNGTYDVHYRSLAGQTAVPANPDARIASSVTVGGDASLPVDVQTADVTPAYTIDGDPFSLSPVERGEFRLVGATEGDVIVLGSSHQVPSTVRVVAGYYDVVYDWQVGSASVPRNVDHPVRYSVDLTTSQVMNVDITTKVVKPTFTLDGAPFPTDAGEAGWFTLRSLGGGEIALGASNQITPANVTVIQDLYEVRYDWSSGLLVPRNEGRVVAHVLVPEPGVSSGVLSGTLLLVGLARMRRQGRGLRAAFAPLSSLRSRDVSRMGG